MPQVYQVYNQLKQTESFIWIPIIYQWVADGSVLASDVANDTQRHRYQIPSTPDATLKT